MDILDEWPEGLNYHLALLLARHSEELRELEKQKNAIEDFEIRLQEMLQRHRIEELNLILLLQSKNHPES
jgi:hypothetical protein